MRTLFAAALCLVCGYAAQAVDYSGYQVFRVTPSTDEHRRWLKDTETSLGDVLDFWSDIKNIPDSTVDIMVPPGLQTELRNIMSAKNLQHTVMLSDVGQLLASQSLKRMEKRESQPSTQDLASFDYSVYHTYDEIQQWVDEVVAAYPLLTERFELPQTSYEGRTISGFKISGTGGGTGTRKAVYFEGGIHAREWISPATLMYVTDKLLSLYTSGDEEAVRLVDTLDWYIVPSLNVDGYSYTWTEDRLWRKTRSSNVDDTGSGCMGTDPNRNWPFEWGEEGTSAFPCSNVYHGIAPLSEQEVEGVVDFLRAKKLGGQEFLWFIDWHSYSQLIISPWSYSADVPDPDDLGDMTAAGQAMADAIYAVNNVTFIHGPTAKLLYAAAGASNDWGYVPFSVNSKLEGGLGAKYSYVVELRDEGEYGFLLPEDQILDSGEENLQGVLAMGKYILDNEGL